MGNSSGYFLTHSLRWECVVSILVEFLAWEGVQLTDRPTANRLNERDWNFVVFLFICWLKIGLKMFDFFLQGGTPYLSPQRRVRQKIGNLWLLMTPMFAKTKYPSNFKNRSHFRFVIFFSKNCFGSQKYHQLGQILRYWWNFFLRVTKCPRKGTLLHSKTF